MRKVILVNGIISGVIVSVLMIMSIVFQLQGTMDHDNGLFVGYTVMVLALSTIFFGIKTYRDQYENGTIGFWPALKIGLTITLVASLLYAVTWEVYYSYRGQEFMDFYAQCQIDNLKEEGASIAEIETARNEMAMMNESYKSFYVRFPFTILEIFPVGLVISLVCAALLRKSQFLPAQS